MQRNPQWNRRSALQALGAGALGTFTTSCLQADTPAPKAKGNIKQSICRWCYGGIKVDRLAEEAVKLGFKSVELLTIDEYKVIKPYGLTCAMLGRVSIADGLNRTKNHAPILAELRKTIDFAAGEGIPN